MLGHTHLTAFGSAKTSCQHFFIFSFLLCQQPFDLCFFFDNATCQGFNRKVGVSAGWQKKNSSGSSLMEYLARVWANKTRMAVCGNEDSLIGIFSGLIPGGEAKAFKRKVKKRKKPEQLAHARTHTLNAPTPYQKSLTITTCTSNETNSVCSLLHKAELRRQSRILNTIKNTMEPPRDKVSLVTGCMPNKTCS